MKELKLEVGKTYRSREGEEVRIVSKDNTLNYPYQGDNDEWYTESGRWTRYSKEFPEDLIAEVPPASHIFNIPDVMKGVTATRHTFNIPEGTKGITVEQVSNRIVVEMVPEKGPKPGDVMKTEKGSVYIFKSVLGVGEYHNHYAWLGGINRLAIGGTCPSGRPATQEEAQPLFDALRKAGKRWNPETMQVEEIAEIDRIHEWIRANLDYGLYAQGDVAEAIEGYLKYKEGEK